MQPYPPLGTLYAASLLRNAGISVAVFDTMLNDPEEEFQAALERAPAANCRCVRRQFQFPLQNVPDAHARGCIIDILETSQRAGATVLVNGSDASDHALDYLQRGFRCVLLGEAEWTLVGSRVASSARKTGTR